MKVSNMKSPRTGRDVPNQFIMEDEGRGALGNFDKRRVFQSYQTVICERVWWPGGKVRTTLDRKAWNYSRTTAKYRNIFLGESTQETQAKIDSGEYILADLNG